MAPKHYPHGAISQDKVFYTKEWTKEVDKQFIEVLVEQAAEGNFVVGRQNTHAILCAMIEINRQFHTNFDFSFYLDRTKKLHKRYKVFNWIINLFGVKYIPLANTVQCSQEMWEFICREEKLGMAYMLRGEYEFDSLKFIFQEGKEPRDVGNQEHEIIQISSDHVSLSANENHTSDNTNNSFWNELAWYASDSTSEASLLEIDRVSFMSTTEAGCSGKKVGKSVIGPSHRSPSVEPPSSTASNSPFKPF